jgi:hypothetical protein
MVSVFINAKRNPRDRYLLPLNLPKRALKPAIK